MKKSREKGKRGRKKGRREKKKREATTKNRYRGIRTREDRLARTTPRIQSSASTRERERALLSVSRGYSGGSRDMQYMEGGGAKYRIVECYYHYWF